MRFRAPTVTLLVGLLTAPSVASSLAGADDYSPRLTMLLESASVCWGQSVTPEFQQPSPCGNGEAAYMRLQEPRSFLGIPVEGISYVFVHGSLRYIRVFVDPSRTAEFQKRLREALGPPAIDDSAGPGWFSSDRLTMALLVAPAGCRTELMFELCDLRFEEASAPQDAPSQCRFTVYHPREA